MSDLGHVNHAFEGPAALSAGPFACPEEAPIFLDGNLEHATWTTAEAAEAAGVTRDVIYQWRARGKITPINRRGWPRYRAMDVLRAEQSTRERAGRSFASA